MGNFILAFVPTMITARAFINKQLFVVQASGSLPKILGVARKLVCSLKRYKNFILNIIFGFRVGLPFPTFSYPSIRLDQVKKKTLQTCSFLEVCRGSRASLISPD